FVKLHRDSLKDRPLFHEGISAVKIEQFIHGDETSRCRDSRYKFDAEVEPGWAARDPYRQNVLEMLSNLGLEVSRFRREEMNQLSLKYRDSFGETKWSAGM